MSSTRLPIPTAEPLVQRHSTMSGKQLAGKVAVVTGASAGIGKAISIALAAEGASVALVARRLEKLKELEEEIRQKGGKASSVQADVTSREQVNCMVREVESSLGPVDILVNNAGVFYFTMMKNRNEDQWDKMVDVNIKGVNNCVAAVLNGMIDRKEGHIINISSDNGRLALAGVAVYCGTKFYVEGLSKCLREELVGKKVKVTCIQAGDTEDTEIFDFSTDQEAIDLYKDMATIPRLKPEDIAKAVLYAATQPSYSTVNEVLIQPRDTTFVV